MRESMLDPDPATRNVLSLNLLDVGTLLLPALVDPCMRRIEVSFNFVLQYKDSLN